MPEKIKPEYLEEVERRLLSAQTPGDFVFTLAKQYNKSKRQIWRYVSVVRKNLAARVENDKHKEADRELVKSMLLDAFRTAKVGTTKTYTKKDAVEVVNIPDGKAMVQAARTYAELSGVMEPRKFQVETKVSGLAALIAQAFEDEQQESGEVSSKPVQEQPGTVQ